MMQHVEHRTRKWIYCLDPPRTLGSHVLCWFLRARTSGFAFDKKGRVWSLGQGLVEVKVWGLGYGVLQRYTVVECLWLEFKG